MGLLFRTAGGGKAVKAALQRRGAEAWGHSVADLLSELARTEAAAAALRDNALELDKVYIPSRYPDAHQSGSPRTRYTQIEADRLVEYADRIVALCARLLSAS